jgi:hypothetical protein
MFKISWNKPCSGGRTFVLVPDVHALFDAYWVITGYGRRDGCTPIEIVVTNLDGDVIDMSKGAANAASYGTYASK